jgi:hypothetical protein
VRLTDALLTGAFARADLACRPALRLVQAQLGPRGPLPMPPFAFGPRREAPATALPAGSRSAPCADAGRRLRLAFAGPPR